MFRKSKSFFTREPSTKENHIVNVNERPPYKTWDCFTKATSGHFQPLIHHGKLIKTAQEVQQEAWRIYSSTQDADDKRFTQFPYAITYTGADYNVLQRLKDYSCFNKNEDMTSLHKAGWVYIPEIHHTWSLNGIWILSQIHKGRSFVSISDASFKLSAYTKELHCIFKSDYKISGLTFLHDGHTLVYLTPPTQGIALKTKFEDFIHISSEDCARAQQKFNNAKQELIRKALPKEQKFSQIVAIAKTNVKENNGIFIARCLPHLSLFSLQNKYIAQSETFTKVTPQVIINP